MVTIKRIDIKEPINEAFIDEILSFDEKNMQSIIKEANINFPIEKRRKGFKNNPTFIIAYNENNEIIGYLQYSPSWNSEKEIYIGSLQIEKAHRGGSLLIKLLLKAKKDLQNREFNQFVSHVQKNNTIAIKLYKKLGFNIIENQKDKSSYLVFADRSLIYSNLFDKYNKERS